MSSTFLAAATSRCLDAFLRTPGAKDDEPAPILKLSDELLRCILTSVEWPFVLSLPGVCHAFSTAIDDDFWREKFESRWSGSLLRATSEKGVTSHRRLCFLRDLAETNAEDELEAAPGSYELQGTLDLPIKKGPPFRTPYRQWPWNWGREAAPDVYAAEEGVAHLELRVSLDIMGEFEARHYDYWRDGSGNSLRALSGTISMSHDGDHTEVQGFPATIAPILVGEPDDNLPSTKPVMPSWHKHTEMQWITEHRDERNRRHRLFWFGLIDFEGRKIRGTVFWDLPNNRRAYLTGDSYPNKEKEFATFHLFVRDDLQRGEWGEDMRA